MKVSIIGSTGRVGKSTALCLAEEETVSVLQLISRKESFERSEGELLDISDALAAKGVSVELETSSDIEDVHDSKIIIITAGVPRKPGMERDDLAPLNGRIVANYASRIGKFAPDSMILVVTNPVDVMTYVALKYSGFHPSRVFGLGNHLDSLRLKNYMARHFNVHVSEVHTRVIGQHGPYMVPLISSTSIGGIPLEYYSKRDYFSGYKRFDLKGTIEKVINAGSDIISRKGATEYGPAFAVSNIVKTILNDEKRILTVSTLLEGEVVGIRDVCLGVPVKLGKNGIEGIVPFLMDSYEREAFFKAAEVVGESTREVMRILEEEGL